MKVTRLFPRTLEEGSYLENIAVFAARRCRTQKSHEDLMSEVMGYSDKKKYSFVSNVVIQDWALDILEFPYLIYDWEDIPLWLVIELIRHRYIARDFSLEQLSQRAILGSKLKFDVDPSIVPLLEKYMQELASSPEYQALSPEAAREAVPQGVLVNLAVAGNLRAWQHVFYMRAPEEIGGKGGAHPKFQELAKASFNLALEVYPTVLREILPS